MKRSEIREEIGRLKGLVKALEEGVRAGDLEREVERLQEALESKDRKLRAAEERVRALEAMDSKILRLERELSMLGGLRAIYDARAGERRCLSLEGEEVVVVYFDGEGNRLSRARLDLEWFFECERRKGPLCRREGE